MSDPYEPIMRSDCEKEKQELIEVFLFDLGHLWCENAERGHSNNTYAIHIEKYQKKWEKRLKQ